MDPTDRDSLRVVELLRTALSSSKLSQARFACAVGASPSQLSNYLSGAVSPSARFVMKAQRLGESLGSAEEAGLMSAPATAQAMRRGVRSGEDPWVWRMLLQGRDHLLQMLKSGDPRLIDAWEARPGDAGSPEWSALLATVAAHTFEGEGVTPPGWSLLAPLSEPWRPEHPFLSPARVNALTPSWLARQNIFVPERDLATA